MMRFHALSLMGLIALLMSAAPDVAAQAPRWSETASWSGQGIVSTGMFYITGERWRVKYVPVRSDRGSASFEVFVRDAQGKVLAAAAETPELLRGGRTYKNDRGPRYLTIVGVNTAWEVTVEQYVSIIEEWQAIKEIRQRTGTHRKIGEWAGGETFDQYDLSIDAGKWKVVYGNEGAGRLQIEVTDAKGNVVLNSFQQGTGRQEGWVYTPGDYRLSVKADTESRWRIVVFSGTDDKQVSTR